MVSKRPSQTTGNVPRFRAPPCPARPVCAYGTGGVLRRHGRLPLTASAPDEAEDTGSFASIMRVAIFGAPGSGKSHLAARLGSALSLPVAHLDDLFWLPGWRESEAGRFRDEVADLVSAGAWVVDGNYSRVRDLVLGRATWAVAIDLSFWMNVWRVTARPVGRRFGSEQVTPLPRQVRTDGEPLLEALRAVPPVIWSTSAASSTPSWTR